MCRKQDLCLKKTTGNPVDVIVNVGDVDVDVEDLHTLNSGYSCLSCFSLASASNLHSTNTHTQTKTQTQQDKPAQLENTHKNTTNANTKRKTNKTNLLGTEPWLNDGTDVAAGGS